MPHISVVMPIYNGARYLREAIDSILTQHFKDFELIAIDDGSTDRSAEIVSSIKDSRVRLVAMPGNSGTAAATRRGHEVAQGTYIAHMDQDDIAPAYRLQAQIDFFRANPGIKLLGGMVECFGTTQARILAPEDDATIKAQLLVGVQNIINPTAMFRRELVKESGLRCDPSRWWAFDWNFFVDAMFAHARFANLPRPLVHYRLHAGQQSRDLMSIRTILSAIRKRVMAKFFPALSEADMDLLEPLLQWSSPPGVAFERLQAGLAVIPKAMACGTSEFGENTRRVRHYLAACQQRWQAAMQRHAG